MQAALLQKQKQQQQQIAVVPMSSAQLQRYQQQQQQQQAKPMSTVQINHHRNVQLVQRNSAAAKVQHIQLQQFQLQQQQQQQQQHVASLATQSYAIVCQQRQRDEHVERNEQNEDNGVLDGLQLMQSELGAINQVRAGGKLALDAATLDRVVDDLTDSMLRSMCAEVALDMHRKQQLGLLCLNCTSIMSNFIRMPGHDVFGQLMSSKAAATESFACDNCRRTVNATRYASHLEKCMGLGRSSSRIATRRLTSSKAAAQIAASSGHDAINVGAFDPQELASVAAALSGGGSSSSSNSSSSSTAAAALHNKDDDDDDDDDDGCGDVADDDDDDDDFDPAHPQRRTRKRSRSRSRRRH
jgi:Sgf11 (transcriptional regulation protein)